MRQPGGLDFTGYAQALRGVDVLIHDAEFLPEEYARYAKGWGHSVHLDTARLAVEARAGRLVMWHHNQDRSDREVSAMLAQVRRVAEGTPLRCDAAKPQMTIRV
jgi:ribonuclease BN (tRNA processing enzyme)